MWHFLRSKDQFNEVSMRTREAVARLNTKFDTLVLVENGGARR